MKTNQIIKSLLSPLLTIKNSKVAEKLSKKFSADCSQVESLEEIINLQQEIIGSLVEQVNQLSDKVGTNSFK